jgi:type I restriction enzyme, S subunit
MPAISVTTNANGWQEMSLGEFCEIYQPKTISRKQMIEDGEYPVFGANGVIGRHNEYNHENSELLITCRGATCGSVNVSLPKSWITGNAMVVRPDETLVLRRFLEYAFQGPIDLSSVITGAAQPQITRTNLSPVRFAFPPLSEQQRIVNILDGVFNNLEMASESAQKGITNVQRLFDSQFQQLFSVNEEKGIMYSMSDICSITSVLVDPKQEEFQNLLHVGGANIVTKSGKLIKLKTTEEEGLKSGKFVFDSQMVLYSKIRPYLMKVARPDFEGLCSADIYPLTCNEEIITRDYLFYLLLSPNFTHFAIQGSARAGMPKVNRKHLFSYETILPTLEVQHRITRSLDEMVQKTEKMHSVVSQKMQAIDELKQSILQEAFNGTLLIAEGLAGQS